MAEAEHVAALLFLKNAGRKVRAPQGKTLRNTESPLLNRGKESAAERETTSDFVRRKGEKVSQLNGIAGANR